jgi:hypothetical protein
MKRKQRHSDEEPFVPASKIARTENFRATSDREGVIEGGPRIGIPPDRIPEDDMEGFSISLTQGMNTWEDLGPLSALGRHLIDQGKVREHEVFAAETAAPDMIAQTDREEEAGRGAGTPGRGIPLQDRYQHEKDVGVRQGGPSTRALRRQLSELTQQVEYCLIQAQIAQDKGNSEAARILDAKARKYANHAENLNRRILLREDYETRVR